MRSAEILGLANVGYIPICLDNLIACGFAAMLSHSGCVIQAKDQMVKWLAKFRGTRMGWVDLSTNEERKMRRQENRFRIARRGKLHLKVAREVEKGSEAEARLYSALYDCLVVDKL